MSVNETKRTKSQTCDYKVILVFKLNPNLQSLRSKLIKKREKYIDLSSLLQICMFIVYLQYIDILKWNIFNINNNDFNYLFIDSPSRNRLYIFYNTTYY